MNADATILLHDTLSGELRPLEPRVPGRVGIYACGPTVYGRVHVGNARPFVVFSMLKRFLGHEGLAVTLVANITDVNDKIYAAAGAAGVGSEALAAEMTAHYVADTDRLGLGRPDFEPRAAESIPSIVSLIERLIDSGYAYVADGDVYFSVRRYPAYGELSHRRVEDMDQGEGGEGVDRKRDAVDFALWKAEKPGEDTSWEAPWGRGRPGWHIECSAMAEDLLGLDFEIHGGGSDLVFPHHENEAAQTGAATGRPLARLWMHNGMIRTDAEKMSKSLGNIFLLHAALDTYGRDALLLYFCSGHYRQPIEFDAARLAAASASVERLREVARRLAPDAASPAWSGPLRERFFAALRRDFNTPRALAAVWDWVREANRASGAVGDSDLREMLDVLGLAGLLVVPVAEAPQEARALADERELARGGRDFARADALRDELREMGWEVRDGPGGYELLPIEPGP